MENNEKRNYNPDGRNYKMENNQNRDDQNKEQFEEFSNDQPNFRNNDPNINLTNSEIPNNRNNPNLDIAHKYYGGANQKDEGFLDNSEFNSSSSAFRPLDPKLDEEGYPESPNFSDSAEINNIAEFDGFEDQINYSKFYRENKSADSDAFNFDDNKNKTNKDNVSESGYDKNIGMQRRDDSRFK